MKKHKIAIAGASGFVGGALQKSFEDVIILHRNDSIETLLNKLKNHEKFDFRYPTIENALKHTLY